MTAVSLRAAAKHLKINIQKLDEIDGPEDMLREMRLTAELNLIACLLGQGLLRHECSPEDLPITQRTDIANRILPIIEHIKKLWLKTNRNGGLEDSLNKLRHPLDILLKDTHAGKGADRASITGLSGEIGK